MQVGKPSLQPVLKQQMHGQRGFDMPQQARVDVMVERENVEIAR